MQEVFLRKYSLTIGRSATVINRTQSSAKVTPGGRESTPAVFLTDGSYEDFIVKPAGAIVFTDLRMTAKIVDSKAGVSNKQKATISLFNLSSSSQSKIKTEDTIILRAGYVQDGNELPLVYIGQIVSVETVKKGQDTITKFICKAAAVGRSNIRISRVPVRDENGRDIANYFAGIAASNGIPTGNVFVPIALPYPTGFPAAGEFFPIMEEFCNKNNLKCYTSLGRLYIEPQDLSTFDVDIGLETFIPTSSTIIVDAVNVKGSIKPADDSTKSGNPKATKGLKITLFLDGRITASKLIKITFGIHKGEYIPDSVEFEMDSEGAKWDTIVSCTKRT